MFPISLSKTILRTLMVLLRPGNRSRPSFWIKKRTSHLHYITTGPFNCLSSGLLQSSSTRLQIFRNAAARSLTGTKKCKHIARVPARLHWLPVHFRIPFKTSLIALKALSGQAPPILYHFTASQLPGLLDPTTNLSHVPQSGLKLKGDRAFFLVAVQQLWLDTRCAASCFLNLCF